MALIKCWECQQTISDKATACPHCGAPVDLMTRPPPVPPELPDSEWRAKPRQSSVAGRAVSFILAIIAGTLLWLYIIGQSETPSHTATQTAAKPVSAELDDHARKQADLAKKADELARKEAEEARCREELKCIGDKNSFEATLKCVPLVERLAKNNFEWLDKWYEPKFSHFRWKDQKNLVVTYIGDKIKFQNGFGAWVLSRYECDYSIPTGSVLDVRASAGRLPS